MPYYWRARHKYRSQFAKKSTLWLTNASIQCSQNQVINGSYLSQRWKILLASSATTFAHRRTSSSNTYWLIQAKSRLNVHTATFLVQASKLKTHKLTHSGEEPFICIQCNFSYTQADNLKRHMKTHTGEKTHKCAHCSVWLFFHSWSQAGKSHAHPYRRKVFRVWSMCLFLCSVSTSETTQAQTHRRETVQLWPMWLFLCLYFSSEAT